MIDYRGKIVFLEKKDPNAKSQYGGGEFLVIEQSPNNLHVVGFVVGYGAHRSEQKALTGADAFTVISVTDDKECVKRFAADLKTWSEAPKRGEKLSWVECVYTDAGRTARKIEQLIGCSCPEPTVADSKTHTLKLDGYTITVSISA